MKMDAMQKKRMWKVASIHFALAALIYLVVLYLSGLNASKGGPFHPNITEQRVIHQTWVQFCWKVLMILQPLPFLVILIIQLLHQNFTLFTHPNWLVVSGLFGILLASSLLWSVCFGWLFIKLKDWLNHFPILGRKFFLKS